MSKLILALLIVSSVAVLASAQVVAQSTSTITSNSNTPTTSARFEGRRSRGTGGNPQPVQNNDQIVNFLGLGWSGTSYRESSGIRFSVDGSVTVSSIPTRIGFFTTPLGGTATVERMRITSSGLVGIGTTNPTAELDVLGTITTDFLQLPNGVSGYVLTSDANGFGTWKPPVPGPQGPAGPIGPTGLTGATGPQGEQGIQGLAGPAGPQGSQGEAGGGIQWRGSWNFGTAYVENDGIFFNGSSYRSLTSNSGSQPDQAPTDWILIAKAGDPGPQGEIGTIGLTGPAGPQGEQGIQGLVGPAGPQGEIGPVGLQGPVGLTGSTGPQGEIGPIGLTGATGPQGEQGIQGLVGPAGPQGIQGEAGGGIQWRGSWNFGSAYIENDGIFFNGSSYRALVNNSGSQPDQAPTDWTLIAKAGDPGPQGEIGPIGLTGPAGPQGEQGIQGLVGPAGPQGEIGPVGLTGPTGPQGELGPIGLTGSNGPQGEQGIQGLVGLTGPQGEIGPVGPQGPIGLTGATGSTGPQGPAGVGVTSRIFYWNTFSFPNVIPFATVGLAPWAGVNPDNWRLGGATATQIPSDKEIQRSFFINKSYPGRNHAAFNTTSSSNFSDEGVFYTSLLRVQNTTVSAISWNPCVYFSGPEVSLNQKVSIALNGISQFTGTASGTTCLSLSIPAGRTSSLIFVVPPSRPVCYYLCSRSTQFGFYNDALNLPSGLKLVDDLETATGGYEQ